MNFVNIFYQSYFFMFVKKSKYLSKYFIYIFFVIHKLQSFIKYIFKFN